MGLFRMLIGDTAKSVVDVPSWVGYKYLKNIANSIYAYVKSMLKGAHSKAVKKETFMQAVERLQLTEEDLQKKSRHFTHQIYFFLLLATCCLVYSFYLFFQAAIFAAIFSLFIVVFLLLKAYIAHFWRFQIKQRKLGCTFKEWLHGRCINEEKVEGRQR